MKTITIDNRIIPFTIAKKNNKNTYFYFKKDGYIQINLSRYQTSKFALEFIRNNSTSFLRKFDKAMKVKKADPTKYFYLGKELSIMESNDKPNIQINEYEFIQPLVPTDQLNKLITTFEKTELLKVLENLKQKYINNPIIDISNIYIKTRYTKTRFGSCNARLGNINMTTHLIHYDIKYIEYVFLHEICHLKHQDHSVNFYNVLVKLCPNYKQLRKELKIIYR